MKGGHSNVTHLTNVKMTRMLPTTAHNARTPKAIKYRTVRCISADPSMSLSQPATQNTISIGQMLHTRQYRLTLLLNKASAELLFIYKSIIYSIVTKYKRVERQVSLNDDTIFIITFVTNSMPLLLKIWTM